MKTCPKCKQEYPDEQPYCTNADAGCLTMTIERIDQPESGGIYTHLVEMKYPATGHPDPVSLGQNATVKRALISTIRLVFKNPLHPVKNIVYWLADIYRADYEKHQLPIERLAPSSRELLRVGMWLVHRIKDPDYLENAKRVVWCLVMFVDMDMAYRFRFQDVLAELRKENLLKSPRKEIIRLMELFLVREGAGNEQYRKMRDLVRAIKLLILIPPVKRTIVECLTELDIGKVKPSVADLYWMARYFDYDFAGLPYNIRAAWKEKEDQNWVKPKLNPKDYANVAIQPNMHFFNLNEWQMRELVDKIKDKLIETYRNQKNR